MVRPLSSSRSEVILTAAIGFNRTLKMQKKAVQHAYYYLVYASVLLSDLDFRGSGSQPFFLMIDNTDLAARRIIQQLSCL